MVRANSGGSTRHEDVTKGHSNKSVEPIFPTEPTRSVNEVISCFFRASVKYFRRSAYDSRVPLVLGVVL